MFAVARRNIITADYQRLDREWQPKLAAHADAIAFTPGLFGRIEDVYNSLPANLDADQVRLVTRVYDDSYVAARTLVTQGRRDFPKLTRNWPRYSPSFEPKCSLRKTHGPCSTPRTIWSGCRHL